MEDFITDYFGSHTSCITLAVTVRVNEITLIIIVLKFFAVIFAGLDSFCDYYQEDIAAWSVTTLNLFTFFCADLIQSEVNCTVFGFLLDNNCTTKCE